MTRLDAAARPDVGFYGKLPTHGDFLRRRVSDAFVEPWDGWLQSCIAASRDALADRWLDVYLTSPVWRFVCAAGACGPNPVAGIIAPSVDRVGRYFPLTVVVELPSPTSLVSLPHEAAEFFDNAERLIVDALSAQQPDFDGFDAAVARLTDYLPLTPPSQEVNLEASASAILDGGPDARWQFPIGSASRLNVALQQLLDRQLSQRYDPFVMWWTEGSSLVEPSCTIQQGLPAPDSFAALLDGSWADRQWRSVSVQLDIADEPGVLLDAATPRRFLSAAASDVGKVRKTNQDSFIERTDVGIWAVADGVGGHSHGEVASRMVCDALADITPESRFADVIASARVRLGSVNDYLFRQAGDDDSRRSGSTVVVLLTRGSRYAVLWAGDSRMYLLRDGQLRQITRDHSATEIDEDGVEHDAHGITRAVGGDAELKLDEIQDRLQVGDRFLLCSDGLTREVPDEQICAQLGSGDVRTAADALVKSALGSNGRDNVTALIVEAGA
jgi:type VI secretion system protein ImpM